jgi:hypothetical protein
METCWWLCSKVQWSSKYCIQALPHDLCWWVNLPLVWARGSWINHGLPMCVAIDWKPENGCEIQNAPCGCSGVMLQSWCQEPICLTSMETDSAIAKCWPRENWNCCITTKSSGIVLYYMRNGSQAQLSLSGYPHDWKEIGYIRLVHEGQLINFWYACCWYLASLESVHRA